MNPRRNNGRVHAALQVVGALATLLFLAGCGGSGKPEPVAPTTPVGPEPPLPSRSAVGVPVPLRPPHVAAPGADRAIEDCIEKRIHDKAFDSLAPRDARRKLRRLQVKAECEDRLASR